MAAAVPIIAAVISSAGAYMAAEASKPDVPEPAEELKPAAVQTVDPGKQKEADILAQQEKRKKQGYLESFGTAIEENKTGYGLL